MRTTSTLVAGFCLLKAIAALGQTDGAAGPPYAGTWKLDIERSSFGETTVSYSQPAPGQMQLSAFGQSYVFRIDGTDYPSLFGGTSAWKQIDATTWETTIKQDGKLISTVTSRLSADGKNLTTSERGPKQTGGTFEQTTVYARASGGAGLLGTWTTKAPPRWPRVVELAAAGADGLVIRFPDDLEVCVARFDGEDHPLTGPVAQPDMTLALRRTSARSFHVTGRQAGKAIFEISFAVSADGQTLTQAGRMNGGEEVVAVYRRE